MHAYAIEESTIDQNEYLKDYLRQDLHVREEKKIIIQNLKILIGFKLDAC